MAISNYNLDKNDFNKCLRKWYVLHLHSFNSIFRLKTLTLKNLTALLKLKLIIYNQLISGKCVGLF